MALFVYLIAFAPKSSTLTAISKSIIATPTTSKKRQLTKRKSPIIDDESNDYSFLLATKTPTRPFTLVHLKGEEEKEEEERCRKFVLSIFIIIYFNILLMFPSFVSFFYIF